MEFILVFFGILLVPYNLWLDIKIKRSENENEENHRRK